MRSFLKRWRGRLTGTGAVLARLDEKQSELHAMLQSTSTVHRQAIETLQAHVDAQSRYFEDALARLEERKRQERSKALAERIATRALDAPVRVTFLFQVTETWSTWATVWEALAKDPRVAAKLVCMPFFHDEEGLEDRMRAFLAERDIPFVHHSAYDLAADAPDVVFFQNPYDSTRPEAYSSARLASLGIRLAYIPYGLDLVGGDNIRWQYDLELQRIAWRIFARSPRHRRMFARYCQAGSAHVFPSGHPKLDRFAQGLMDERSGAIAEAVGNRRAVLWTPHFSVEDGGWSTYLQHGEAILSAFEKRRELALIIRPHPLFFPRLRKLDLMDEAGEVAFRARLKAAGMILDESPDYAEAFACSEALMTDAGSFLLEYLPTEKPVLYLEQPLGPGLTDEGSLVQDYYQARQHAEIFEFIEMVARGEDPLKPRRMALIAEYLTQLDGRSGARIGEHVVEAVLTERRQARRPG